MRALIVVLVLMFAALQYRLWFGEGNLPSVWALESSMEEQQKQNDKLASRNQALVAEVDDLRSGLAAIEERARSELGMVREGETFFLLPESTN